MLLIGMTSRPCIEVHTARGRSDLEVDVGDNHWVFDLKYAHRASEVPKRLKEAVDQIKNKAYGLGLHGKTLCRLALVFDQEQRQIVSWERV